jgi:hypothetical protein
MQRDELDRPHGVGALAETNGRGAELESVLIQGHRELSAE